MNHALLVVHMMPSEFSMLESTLLADEINGHRKVMRAGEKGKGIPRDARTGDTTHHHN